MSIRSSAPLSTMNVLDASDKEEMQVKNDWRNTMIFDAAPPIIRSDKGVSVSSKFAPTNFQTKRLSGEIGDGAVKQFDKREELKRKPREDILRIQGGRER